MQLCLNLFQHLSLIYFIWCTARYNSIKTPVPTNNTRSAKLRGAQRSPELVFRSADLLLPENLIFPALIRLPNFIFFNVTGCNIDSAI